MSWIITGYETKLPAHFCVHNKGEFNCLAETASGSDDVESGAVFCHESEAETNRQLQFRQPKSIRDGRMLVKYTFSYGIRSKCIYIL